MNDQPVTLKRTLSLPLITLYGLGNILGAGIYVLVGKVAGVAGYFAPLSFLIASIIAAISAFTYAELSSRYPVSAGEAVYIYEGFGTEKLALVIGLLITLAGIVSSATVAHGFAGYVSVFIDWPQWLIIVSLLLGLGGLAAWGINQSVKVAMFLTVIEIGGLLLIISVGADHLPQLLPLYQMQSPDNVFSNFTFVGVLAGAFLAFFAYIGFEDMVNISEEVKNPQKTMPKAILWSVAISTVLYAMVAFVALSVLPPDVLIKTDAPLAAVYEQATGHEPVVISIIGMFAVINGALVQLIMAARLFYGMADRGWLPKRLSIVHPVTRTPLNSTLLTVGLMIFFALILPMVTLAELTSYLVLLVFTLVNLALIRIKRRLPNPPMVSVFPIWIPWLGFISTALFLLTQLLMVLFS